MAGLDCTAPSPRVNGALLAQYVGKKVKLVGRVEGTEGNILRLATSDKATVNVTMLGMLPQCQFLEVEGLVNSPDSLTEESSCAFGDNFDLQNYDQLCKLSNSQQYRFMFLP